MKFNPQRALSILKTALPRTPGVVRERLAQYAELVAQYDSTARLTGYNTVEQLVEGLVVESARLLELGPLRDGDRWIDLGSGNGSPVIPLALLCAQARFTAIESNQRKAAFLGIAATSLGLANLQVAAVTVQEWTRQMEQPYDGVTSRAFAPPSKLFPLARRLLKPGGEIRGFFSAQQTELQDAAQAAGYRAAQVLQYAAGEAARTVYQLRQA